MAQRSSESAMFPQSCQIALKEWAVACRALDQGRQVVLLRKGGIHEDDLDFRVVHPQFVLYPTFEHQKKKLLKPEWHAELEHSVAEAPGPNQITFSHFAEVTSLIEVSQQEKVDVLSPLYLWTTQYAQARLHWKPSRPLTVLLVRAYRMQPVTAVLRPEYAGCTSWVPLAQDIPLRGLAPVLPDAEYQAAVQRVLETLGAVPSSHP